MQQRRFKVAVLGANGHTGRFVVNELLSRGMQAIAVARSDTPSAGEILRTADFSIPASLDDALQGADAALNCAGPFFDTAEPAARAAIRAGIPYLDITAEQWTAARLFETLDAPAKSAGVTIVPAMAFYGGLAELMVSALVGSARSLESVEIATALDTWHPTRVTRKTGARNIYPKHIIRDGSLVPVPDPRLVRDWEFPEPFNTLPVACAPMSEMILLSRRFHIQEATSYLNIGSLTDLSNPSTPPPIVLADMGRSAQRFTLDVKVELEGEQRRATAVGHDIYAVTAPILVQACLTLLEATAPSAGVQPPGEIFAARAFLEAMAPVLTIHYGP